MKWSRAMTFLIIFSLVVPLMISTTGEVKGGKPIFRSNILAVWDNNLYNQKPWDMEVDPNGRIYIAYTTDQMYYPDPYLVHSDDGGITWSGSFRIDDVLLDGNQSNDRSSQNAPRMALAANNTVYVVWADERDKTYFMEQSRHIRIAWSEDGENFSRSVRIDPIKKEQTWDARAPDIAINDDGRIFVTWLDKKDSGAYNNIWSSYSDDGGVTWSEMLLINDDGIYFREHDFVRCVMRGDDVYVTWQDKRGADNQYRPYVAVSNDAGETFGPNKAVSDDKEQYNSRQWPSPALDDEGNLYITWRDKRTGSDEIWFTRSENKGGNFSTNVRIAIVPEGSEDWYPYTAAMGNGQVGVVFQRSVPSQETTDEGEIFYINSSDGGRTWDALMRVDDTDRYWLDLSTQEKPLVAFDPTGRAVATWADHRDYYSSSREVYFSSHSGPVDGPNHRPKVYDETFWSIFDFNPKVGSSLTNITFACNYSDQDNDVPIEGYPRIQIYTDQEGTEPVLEAPVVMEQIFPNDIDYMDGVYYEAVFRIPVEGQIYYTIEVIEERDSTPLISPVFRGPIIDATAPKLTVIAPINMTWHNSETVLCRVRVEDFEGGNIREGSIKVRKSINGLENLEKGIPLSNKLKIDNNTYEAWGNVRLSPGQDNFIMFEAKDMVGNGPGLSDPVNVYIDPDPPFYTARGPVDLQLFETVNCTIQWLDHLPGSVSNTSGLNLSTIEYAYRTTSGPLTEWARPDGINHIGKGVYNCWVNLEFPDEGIYSFIKWRASDNLGNVEETGEFRIKVDVPDNYRPIFTGGAFPDGVVSSTPHLFWDSAHDEEGDKLFYRIMLLRHPGDLQLTHWIDVGERTFYDVTNDIALDPGWYVLRVNVTDNLGGYDILDHIFTILDHGTPPPQDVPQFGPYYTCWFPLKTDFVMEWEQSPSHENMDVTYMIRIGTRPYLGDVLEWTNIGRIPAYPVGEMKLPVGMFSVQIMATASNNFSRVTQGTLKVNDYYINHWSPEEALSYRGHGRGYSVKLTNVATFDDNVTVRVEGYLAEEGWAYLDKSGGREATYRLPSQSMAANPEPVTVDITIFPEEDIEKRTYRVSLLVTSEDGESWFHTVEVRVNVKDKPRDGFGQELSDDLYGFLTDTFPFLRPIKQTLLVPLFLFFVALIITLISLTGILIYQKKFITEIKEDPYAQQRKLYRDLYGVDPTTEQLKTMVGKEGEEEEDDFFSDIPDINDDVEGPEKVESEEDRPETDEIKEPEQEDLEVAGEDGGDVQPPEEEEEEIEEMEEYLDPDDL